MRHCKKKCEITVQGIVSPAGWGMDGEIKSVCIGTSALRLYFVRSQKSGLNLFDCIKREVVVTGTLSLQGDKSFIDVSHAELYFSRRSFSQALESREEGCGLLAGLQKV